jgi:hypothetical protein
MKRPGKLLCLLLCVCLVIPLACVGISAASGGAKLIISSPKTLPAVGEQFSVTVSLTGNPGFNAAQFTLTSDSAVVTCVSAKIGKLLSGSLSASNPSASTGAIIAAANTETMTGDGTLGVFTYKVVSSGDPKFALSDVVLSDSAEKPIPFMVGTAELTTGADTSAGTGGNGTGGTTVPDKGNDTGSQTGGDTPVQPQQTEQTFSDVPQSHWAYQYIQKAVAAGLFQGMPDGTFRPGENVTRAQFITVLWRMAGKPAATKASSFTDVPAGQYYTEAVAWGAEKGYINGSVRSDGTSVFMPGGSITREQAMAILFRYSGSQSGAELMLTGIYDKQFTDSGSISPYAKSAVYWAVYNSYISGTSETTLSPQAKASRAQLAKILVNYLEKTKA